jgi:hypothetical protein
VRLATAVGIVIGFCLGLIILFAGALWEYREAWKKMLAVIVFSSLVAWALITIGGAIPR